jgi:hypothetical protein
VIKDSEFKIAKLIQPILILISNFRFFHSFIFILFVPLEVVVVQLFSLEFLFYFILIFLFWLHFIGRKHFFLGAKVGREHFSYAANISQQARTFFHRPQTFLSKREHFFISRKHFPSDAKVRRKHFFKGRKHFSASGNIFQRAQTFFFKRKGWAQTFFTGRKHFHLGARSWRKVFKVRLFQSKVCKEQSKIQKAKVKTKSNFVLPSSSQNAAV